MLGFFGVTPYTRIFILDLNKPANLVFVFSGGAGEGTFGVDMKVTDEQGIDIPNPGGSIPRMEVSKEKSSTNIYMGFQGTFRKPGKYRVTLTVDGKDHYHTTVDIGTKNPSNLLGKPN